MPSAASGLILIDMLVRPFFKVATKFPMIGLLVLCAFYGCVAYVVLRSAFVEDAY